MTIHELRWKETVGKKIRRASWAEGDYLHDVNWSYGGLEWAYEPKGESPMGMLYIAKTDSQHPFHVTPGHMGTDWEIV
jgi:hypothetical protein